MKKFFAAILVISSFSVAFGAIPTTLKLGSTGASVKELQKFLNQQGFVIASKGAGSPGRETTTFGPATLKAFLAYQAAYSTVITTSTKVLPKKTISPATLLFIQSQIATQSSAQKSLGEQTMAEFIAANTSFMSSTTIESINLARECQGGSCTSTATPQASLPSGSTTTATVVNKQVPVALLFSSSSLSVRRGANAYVSWLATGVDSCASTDSRINFTQTGQNKALFGSFATPPVISALSVTVNCKVGQEVVISKTMVVTPVAPLPQQPIANIPQVPKPTVASSSVVSAATTTTPTFVQSLIPSTLYFSSSQSLVKRGTSVTLSWQGSGLLSCFTSWTNGMVAPTGTFVTGSLYNMSFFTLTCKTISGGVVTKTIGVDTVAPAAPVTVAPAVPTQPVEATPTTSPFAPSVTLTSSQTTVAPGDTVTLRWTSTNLGLCSGSWGTSTLPLSGSYTPKYIVSNKTYTLSCFAATGAVYTKSVTVTVNQNLPPVYPAMSITSPRELVQIGGGNTVYWDASSYDSCTQSWLPESQGVAGHTNVTDFSGTTTYALTCAIAGIPSVTKSVTVGVTEAEVVFTSPTAPIVSGNIATLVYSAKNSVSCVPSWSGVSSYVSGVYATPVLTSDTTYSVTCKKTNGTYETATMTVKISRTISATLLANPIIVPYGGTTTLSWITNGVTSCTPSWATGTVAPNSTYVTPPLYSATDFSLSCTNSTGAIATSSKTVSQTMSNITWSAYSASSTDLAWRTVQYSMTGYTSCKPSWSSVYIARASGQLTSRITASTTYSVSCINSAGYSTTTSYIAGPVVNDSPTGAPLPNTPATTTPATTTPPANAAPYSISVQVNGQGTVYVGTSSKACTGTCSYTFASGEVVYVWLVAKPGAVNLMSSGACVTNYACYVTVNGQKSMVANFDSPLGMNIQTYPPTVFPGKPATISWNMVNAKDCTASWSTLPPSPSETYGAIAASGTFVTPALSANATYTYKCSNLSNVPTTRSTSVNVAVAPNATRLTAQDLAIIVNDADATSTEIAAYYALKRGIPAQNIIHVTVPIKNQLNLTEFNALKASVDAKLPANIQAMAIAWTNPSRVNCNSITSALARGYINDVCAGTIWSASTSPYYNSYSARPYTDYKIRPAMMLAGKTKAGIKAMIDKGVASDGTFPSGKGYIMKTSDNVRSLRANVFSPTNAGKVVSPYVTLSVMNSNSVSNSSDTLFYFQGLASVSNIATNNFPAGAVADHLTSYGGMLTDSSQMSILNFVDAGVTGSYGTVSEPYAVTEKFPDPVVMINHYTRGETLIEAYWKSISQTAQGMFVGEPLAHPWGN